MRGGSNRLITADEAARTLGVSRKTVYRHWQEWGWRNRPLGRLIRFPERDVQNFMERTTA